MRLNSKRRNRCYNCLILASSHILWVLFLFIFKPVFGQLTGKQDSATLNILFKASYAFQFPSMDLAKRFGNNSNICSEGEVKFASNFTMGVKGAFIFGKQVREDSILNGIATSQGYHIDKGGELATVYNDERGFTVMATVGKIFPIFKSNANSGPFVQLGVGMLRHKIRYDWRQSNLPQLSKELLKGYDRLTYGPAIEVFAGYMYLSKNRLINFFGGVEYTMAWTRNRRGYNYDTMQYDTVLRKDALLGIRAGWILPIYRKEKKEFFYY
ncbi:hypothetical protein FLAV_02016 [Flavobacteriales bacterium]|nr:hypothetical protein [Bacteroidota bacterium]MBV6462231.1 hypothetical protein [Flavobacteriales bacterium]CAG0985624.1 hypothetical protein FLAV_02016 [Flavobacteriales bacterium]